jgi:hypothetical protein
MGAQGMDVGKVHPRRARGWCARISGGGVRVAHSAHAGHAGHRRGLRSSLSEHAAESSAADGAMTTVCVRAVCGVCVQKVCMCKSTHSV